MRKNLVGALCALAILGACAAENSGHVEGALPAATVRLPGSGATEPAYLVAVEGDLDATLASVEEAPGVATAVAVAIHDLEVKGPEGNESLRVAAVDPLAYRAVAPAPLDRERFLWASLLAGQAALTPVAADRMEVEGPEPLRLPGVGHVTVGAIGDHAVPNLGDVLIDRSLLPDRPYDDALVIVGARPQFEAATLARSLEAAMPGTPTRPLVRAPAGALAPQEPELLVEGEAGPIAAMSFTAMDDGFIKPQRRWIERNIVTTSVSLLGEVSCHKLLIPQLEAALAEVEAEGLAPLIDPTDFGGCYVPRFIDRDPTKPLSMHAFGLAFDINVSTNPLGTPGDMDPRIVEVFERWGFRWGGRWERPDPMHFELHRLVRT